MELDVPPGLLRARRWGESAAADDAVAITNLMQAYAVYTDHGYRDELAALFTADASWEGGELGYGHADGPAAIADLVLTHYDPARPAAHFPGPPLLVRVDDDTVEAFSWCLATRNTDGTLGPSIWFAYDDELRRTPEGWRFSSRELRLRFRG